MRMERPERCAGFLDVKTGSKRAGQNNLAAGGGSMAPILMNLIMQNIRGEHVAWLQQGDPDGGTMSAYPPSAILPGGIQVSPAGLLHRVSGEEHSGQLSAIGHRARQADLNVEVARKSSLRMVSLPRLERSVARRIEEGLPVPESMAQLAGLSQIKYVFVYPENNEIVLAGPADGWRYNNLGQAVSLSDGNPTMQLDDLVTILRTFARGEKDFGCSINTRDEGVKALKEYAESTPVELDSSQTRKWVNELQKKLGRQDVVVWGVPGDSRVARVMVEADYRMKLIGINKLEAIKEIPSYFDLLPVTQQNKAQGMSELRWWLTMQADGVLHSPDKQCVRDARLVGAVPVGKSTADRGRKAPADRTGRGDESIVRREFHGQLCQAGRKRPGLRGHDEHLQHGAVLGLDQA